MTDHYQLALFETAQTPKPSCFYCGSVVCGECDELVTSARTGALVRRAVCCPPEALDEPCSCERGKGACFA